MMTATGLIFSKLARLARNTRELLDFADIFREHNADLISLDVAAFDVPQHPLGFGMIFDRFSAYGLQVVNFFYFPLLGFSIKSSPSFVMLWAFAVGLVFS